MGMARKSNHEIQTLKTQGLDIDYFEIGDGNPIIVFPANNDEFDDPVLKKIAESHRIISLRPASQDYVAANQIAERLPLGLSRLGVQQCSSIGISAGAGPAIALAISAPERIDKVILLSPLLSEGAKLPDLTAVKVPTLVLVGTGDAPPVIDAGRLCREKIGSCHLSFIYGARHPLTGERPEACLQPIVQFLEEGERFIIFRETQLIRR